jgi:hypothetical protein
MIIVIILLSLMTIIVIRECIKIAKINDEEYSHIYSKEDTAGSRTGGHQMLDEGRTHHDNA